MYHGKMFFNGLSCKPQVCLSRYGVLMGTRRDRVNSAKIDLFNVNNRNTRKKKV